MGIIWNEQTKLLANSIATVANGCITIGVLAPLAAFIYSSASPVAISKGTLILGSLGWVAAWGFLQFAARRVLSDLRE